MEQIRSRWALLASGAAVLATWFVLMLVTQPYSVEDSIDGATYNYFNQALPYEVDWVAWAISVPSALLVGVAVLESLRWSRDRGSAHGGRQ